MEVGKQGPGNCILKVLSVRKGVKVGGDGSQKVRDVVLGVKDRVNNRFFTALVDVVS